jgi:hypothetical protein
MSPFPQRMGLTTRMPCKHQLSGVGKRNLGTHPRHRQLLPWAWSPILFPLSFWYVLVVVYSGHFAWLCWISYTGYSWLCGCVGVFWCAVRAKLSPCSWVLCSVSVGHPMRMPIERTLLNLCLRVIFSCSLQVLALPGGRSTQQSRCDHPYNSWHPYVRRHSDRHPAWVYATRIGWCWQCLGRQS